MTPGAFSREIGHFAELLDKAVMVTPYLKRRAHELSKCAIEIADTEEGRIHREMYSRIAGTLDGKFGTRPLPLVVHHLRAAAEEISDDS